MNAATVRTECLEEFVYVFLAPAVALMAAVAQAHSVADLIVMGEMMVVAQKVTQ
jgi:hypothetical protein